MLTQLLCCRCQLIKSRGADCCICVPSMKSWLHREVSPRSLANRAIITTILTPTVTTIATTIATTTDATTDREPLSTRTTTAQTVFRVFRTQQVIPLLLWARQPNLRGWRHWVTSRAFAFGARAYSIVRKVSHTFPALASVGLFVLCHLKFNKGAVGDPIEKPHFYNTGGQDLLLFCTADC